MVQVHKLYIYRKHITIICSLERLGLSGIRTNGVHGLIFNLLHPLPRNNITSQVEIMFRRLLASL